MTRHINGHITLQEQRKAQFDEDLTRLYLHQGGIEKALTLSQLANMEQNRNQTNLIGLAMFYAIMSGAQTTHRTDSHQSDSVAQRYTAGVNAEAYAKTKSTVRGFLDRFADMHIDGLERRLTDFINVASDLSMQGVPYVGPPRHTSADILMACKEIVENNAVRIKLDNSLHSRVDMQLILFQEAARRLEGMEADGGSADAVARGSVFTASAKLIRNLHKIMWQWKWKYTFNTKQPQDYPPPSTRPLSKMDSFELSPSGIAPSFAFNADEPFMDGFFTDWDNWPHLGTADLSDLFTYDFDTANL